MSEESTWLILTESVLLFTIGSEKWIVECDWKLDNQGHVWLTAQDWSSIGLLIQSCGTQKHTGGGWFASPTILNIRCCRNGGPMNCQTIPSHFRPISIQSYPFRYTKHGLRGPPFLPQSDFNYKSTNFLKQTQKLPIDVLPHKGWPFPHDLTLDGRTGMLVNHFPVYVKSVLGNQSSDSTFDILDGTMWISASNGVMYITIIMQNNFQQPKYSICSTTFLSKNVVCSPTEISRLQSW